MSSETGFTGARGAPTGLSQLRRLIQDVVRVSAADLAPADFFQELLRRALPALAASAGTVWSRTGGEDFLRLCRLNWRRHTELEGRAALLRQLLHAGDLALPEPSYFGSRAPTNYWRPATCLRCGSMCP